MYRFFVNPKQVENETVRIEGTDVNHIKNVLRMKPGDTILVSDGYMTDCTCTITELWDEFVLAHIEKENENTELDAKIYLFQGLPKSDKMELIVQKAVELGAHKVIPVSMKRCVVKLDEKRAANKIKRYNTIAESAAKQSKRSIIPEVTGIMTYKQALEFSKQLDVVLIPYEAAKNMQETRDIIKGIKKDASIGIFIGPEGGFDENEIEMAKENGFTPITLGRRILRTETAGLTMLSILMFNLED